MYIFRYIIYKYLNKTKQNVLLMYICVIFKYIYMLTSVTVVSLLACTLEIPYYFFPVFFTSQHHAKLGTQKVL